MELNKIYNEDCLEGMKKIPDASVDCVSKTAKKTGISADFKSAGTPNGRNGAKLKQHTFRITILLLCSNHIRYT